MKIIVVLVSLLSFQVVAQTDLFLNIRPKFSGQDFVLGDQYQDLYGIDMSLDYFNYYVSNVHVIHDGGQDLDLSDRVFCVKADTHSFYVGQHDVVNIEQINFSVGVPADINHLDIAQYPIGHPLSFQSPSMHWGWTAGYMFMITGGNSDSDGNSTPDTYFELHTFDDSNFKNVELPLIAAFDATNNYTKIIFDCNIEQWLYGVDANNIGIMHASTGVNAESMNNVNDRAVFTAPGNVGCDEIALEGDIYFNEDNSGDVSVIWEGISNVVSYELIDPSGRRIAIELTSKSNGTATFANLEGGIYVFRINTTSGQYRTINILKR